MVVMSTESYKRCQQTSWVNNCFQSTTAIVWRNFKLNPTSPITNNNQLGMIILENMFNFQSVWWGRSGVYTVSQIHIAMMSKFIINHPNNHQKVKTSPTSPTNFHHLNIPSNQWWWKIAIWEMIFQLHSWTGDFPASHVWQPEGNQYIQYKHVRCNP